MSSAAASIAFSSPSDPKNWITPEEQLECITTSFLKAETKKMSKVSADLPHITSPSKVDPKWIHWYNSLREIDKLPKKVPPLPDEFYDQINQPCPEEICSQRKPNGELYTLGEKGILTLIPENLGTFGHFEKAVKAYGEKHYPADKNPLQLSVFQREAHQKFEKTLFGPTHWEFLTEDVLEGSQRKELEELKDSVASLAKKTSINWQIPEFSGTFVALTLHKIATGVSLYSDGKEKGSNKPKFTSVSDKLCDQYKTAGSFPMAIGGYHDAGVDIAFRSSYSIEYIGTAALWKI